MKTKTVTGEIPANPTAYRFTRDTPFFRNGLALVVVVLVATLSCSCRDSRNPAGSFARAVPEADGYRFPELKRLHENHDPAKWDMSEDIEQLRFGLLRTSELFPTAVISRWGPVRPLETAWRPEIGEFTISTSPGSLPLDDYLPSSPVDAMIVVHRGRIVYERYPHMRLHDRHLYWSVSNIFLGTIVGILEDEGHVDVHAPIEAYIEALAATDWKGTPVIDILDMASGMSGRELDIANAYTDPATLHYQFEQLLGNWATSPREEGDAYEFVANLKRLKPSGQVHEYASVNCFVISWLIQEVTGDPYPDVLSDRLWRKIGADADAGIVIDRESGASWSHGGIFSTLRDLARYGLIYTPSWEAVSEEPIISRAHLAKVQTGGRAGLLEARNRVYPDGAVYTGDSVSTYQWDNVWPDGDFMKAGFQGQFLYVSPGKDLVIATFASGDSAFNGPLHRALATSGLFDE